jgi:hypothetical protein
LFSAVAVIHIYAAGWLTMHRLSRTNQRGNNKTIKLQPDKQQGVRDITHLFSITFKTRHKKAPTNFAGAFLLL